MANANANADSGGDLLPGVNPKMLSMLVGMAGFDDERRDFLVDEFVEAIRKVNQAHKEAREALVTARQNAIVLNAVAQKLGVDAAALLGPKKPAVGA